MSTYSNPNQNLMYGYPKTMITRLMGDYRSHAKKLNVPFMLTRSEFSRLINSNCYYCGIDPLNTWSTGKDHQLNYSYNGLDRVHPDLGYFIGTCVPCCKVCNRAKFQMSHAKFMNWIIRVHTNCRKRKFIPA